MRNTTMRGDKLVRENLEGFENWLVDRGCEILPSTNQYEALRFKGRGTGVVYTSGKFSGDYALIAYSCFIGNKKWNGAPLNTGRSSSYRKQKEYLLERDGTRCFFCNQEMDDDITVDHLLQLNQGGKNTIHNMVLCHSKCNHDVKNMSIVEKVKLSIKNRI